MSASKSIPASRPDGTNPALLVSRRSFLRGLGGSVVSAAALGANALAGDLPQSQDGTPLGPSEGPVTLAINGETRTFQLAPRVTLAEAVRVHAGLTGTKVACDRGTCGACTVLIDDEPVNACMVLALEAQGHAVTTIEGMAKSGELTRLQQALVDQDGLQCGFCSPGFVVTLAALLRRNPHPTEAEVRAACAGNVCRCGSQPRIEAPALAAAGRPATSRLTIIRPHDHALA